MFQFQNFRNQKLETLTRCLVIIVAVIAMLLAWPLNVLKGGNDGNGRLRFDHSLQYSTLGGEVYGSAVLHGQEGRKIESLALQYRLRAVEDGGDVSLHYDLYDTANGKLLDGNVTIPSTPSEGIVTLNTQFEMHDEVEYQLVVYSDEDDRISFSVEKDGSVAVVPHDVGTDTTDAMNALDLCVRAAVWAFGVTAIIFALRGKQDAPGLFVLLGGSFVLVAVTQYLFDHNAESVQALRMGIVMITVITVITMLEVFRPNTKWLRPFILLAAGVIYMIVLTPGIPPDEKAHFYRALEISCGNLFSTVYNGGQGGNVFPAAAQYISDPNAVMDWSNVEIFYFSNTALYFPTCYIPQMIGIWIVRMFTDHVMTIFYAGRIFNFALAYVISLAALRRMPFGKNLLFVFMMFPMTLQEMVSMSPDALTNAVSMYLIALIMSLRMEKGLVSRSELARIFLIGLFLGGSKVVYIVVTFLVLLLPARKLGSKKKAIGIYALMIGSAILMNGLTYFNSLQFLGDLTQDVSAGGQIKFVLGHPVETGLVMVRTLTQDLYIWLEDMLGTEMGSLNIPINRGLAYIMVILMVLATYDAVAPHEYFRHREIVAAFVTGVLGFCATIGSLYVSWSKVGAPKIVGIQGRYFIPFTLIILLALAMIHSRQVSHITTKPVHVQRTYSEKGLRYRITDLVLIMIMMITVCDIYLYYVKNVLIG